MIDGMKDSKPPGMQTLKKVTSSSYRRRGGGEVQNHRNEKISAVDIDTHICIESMDDSNIEYYYKSRDSRLCMGLDWCLLGMDHTMRVIVTFQRNSKTD